MMAWLVAGGGLVVMFGLAIAIGASLDTTAQRRERQRLAEERRRLAEETVAEHHSDQVMCRHCPLRQIA